MRDVPAVKICGQFNQIRWRKTKYAEHTDTEPIRIRPGCHDGRLAS